MSENLGPNPNLKRGHIRGPAKVTKILKQAILDAAEKAGGRGGTTAYLVRQATENPTAFMALLGKILPTQIGNDPDNPLTITVIERVIVKAANPDA
jgi:hypothetical protein